MSATPRNPDDRPLERGPFRPAEEFEVGTEGEPRRVTRKVANRGDAQRLRAVTAHGERIGIFESKGPEEERTISVIDPAGEFLDHRLPSRHVAAVHDVCP